MARNKEHIWKRVCFFLMSKGNTNILFCDAGDSTRLLDTSQYTQGCQYQYSFMDCLLCWNSHICRVPSGHQSRLSSCPSSKASCPNPENNMKVNYRGWPNSRLFSRKLSKGIILKFPGLVFALLITSQFVVSPSKCLHMTFGCLSWLD